MQPVGRWSQPVPSDRRHFPLLVVGMVDGILGWSVPGSLAEENGGTVSVEKRRLIRAGGGGAVSRISNTSRPTEHGGGSSAASKRRNEPALALPSADPRHHRWTPSRHVWPLSGRGITDPTGGQSNRRKPLVYFRTGTRFVTHRGD